MHRSIGLRLSALGIGLLLAHAAPATAIECSDADFVTTHVGGFGYLSRTHFQVWQLHPEQIKNPENLKKSLYKIKDAYHLIPPPKFLKDMVLPDKEPLSFESWVAHSTALRVNMSSENWFVVTNPEYVGGVNPPGMSESGYVGFNAALLKHSLPTQSQWWKCRDGGAVAIGWYKPPKLTEADFDNKTKFDALTAAPGYKTQALDLTAKDDLEWLKKIREVSVAYAEHAFGYSEKSHDRLSLYFHWPTGAGTNTLHLHVRVNYPLSPVEYNRSIMLDDLIAYFGKHKDGTAVDFVAERILAAKGFIINHMKNGSHDQAIYDALKKEFIEVGDVANPFEPIHKAIPMISGAGADKADVQLVPRSVDTGEVTDKAHNEPPSHVRYGQVVLTDKFDKDLVFTNDMIPVEKLQKNKYLSDALLTKLGLKGLGTKTVKEVLSCIRPYFDGHSATRCMEWNATTKKIDLVIH
jgi:hypothetical protein